MTIYDGTHNITTVDEPPGRVVRECSCGWVTIGDIPEPAHHTPLAQREQDHLAEVAAIADGSVWKDIPPVHSYELHLRRRLRDGTPNQIVITAVWTGASRELSVDRWDSDGLASAQAWCDQKRREGRRVVWAHNQFPVEPRSLAVHADAV